MTGDDPPQPFLDLRPATDRAARRGSRLLRRAFLALTSNRPVDAAQHSRNFRAEPRSGPAAAPSVATWLSQHSRLSPLCKFVCAFTGLNSRGMEEILDWAPMGVS